MQTLLYKTLQYIGALLPSVAIGLLTLGYVLWLMIRQCMAWTLTNLFSKLVRY